MIDPRSDDPRSGDEDVATNRGQAEFTATQAGAANHTPHSAAAEAPCGAAPVGPPPPQSLDGTSTAPQPGSSEAPAVLARFRKYELLQELPGGGMGVVYKAHDPVLGRVVALKMIRAGLLARAEEVERFRLEAQAVAQLKHPHIISIYDVGQHEGRHYFTMAFAEGGSVAQHLNRFADAPAAVALVEKIARAVHHAHSRGIFHRDLKPANVLLDEHGEPLVCDFGLAKLLDSDVELTQTGQTVGTPAYMAPEQADGQARQVGAAGDVWALGVILYQLVTGQRPFTGGTRDELLHQVRTTEPPPPRVLRPELDPSLETIVLKCLAKEPARRYASAALLADDLGRWLRAEPIPGRPTASRGCEPPERRAMDSVRRHPLRSAAAVLGAAVLVGLVATLFLHQRKTPPPEEPPIVLIGKTGPPPALNWIVGHKEAVAKAPQGNVPFSFSTTLTSALELLALVPWERYCFEAEICHEAADRGSMVGLFLAHTQRHSPQTPYQTVLSVGFADRGFGAGGKVQVGIWSCSEPRDLATFANSHSVGEPIGPAPKNNVQVWRRLAVQVSPDQVDIFWEGQHIYTWLRAEIDQMGAFVVNSVGDVVGWDFVPQNGLGVYIDGDGRASFRNVVVRQAR